MTLQDAEREEAVWARLYSNNRMFRSTGMWRSNHPYYLHAPSPKGWWYDFHLTWAKIGGRYADDCRAWDRFIWGWQRVCSAVESRVHAEKVRRVEFVRLRGGEYGRVLCRYKSRDTWRNENIKMIRVRVLRDRRYNWVRKPYDRETSDWGLIPVKDWGMDPLAPYNVDIPMEVRNRRRTEARNKKAERARKQVLRRQWRGLE